MKHLYSLVVLLSIFLTVESQTLSRNIIIDQFGYLPNSKKIAIIKNPIVGFDSAQKFSPGNSYALVNANTGEQVFTAALTKWNGGSTDVSSGDKVWYFDFSSVSEKGNYYVLDIQKQKCSYKFEISPIVYKEVLKQAVRFFFYQRSGFPKDSKYAGAGWADGASHIGPLQDTHCRLYNASNDSSTEVDVSGGWYDAGDYNKYTNWTASYIIEMMKAYLENPAAWGDDYNIPESGNSVPDLLDEAKWGLRFLEHMQRPDGGVLCIVGESTGSPPSSATGPSFYGPETTSASLNTAAAFALSSKVYRSLHLDSYADSLLIRAQQAWNWAIQHDSAIFNNNDPANSGIVVGAGNQEEDSYTQSMSKLKAACYLFEETDSLKYQHYFDSAYLYAHLIQWNYAYPFEPTAQEILLYYTTISGATPSVISNILNVYNAAITGNTDNFPAYYSKKDPYLAQLGSYTWGSNSIKSCAGNMFYDVISYGVNASKNADAKEAALNYIHYIHGVNPLNMTYLSNMYHYGAENCVNTFYHSWFEHGSPKWDKVGVSTYGPPPGYLTGGANPGYNWYSGCPNNCGSPENNAACLSENLYPPKGQPDQKSYKDFNTSWPIDSWEVTEPSCGYQVNYIRLLSKFVTANMDCNGDVNGTAYMDTCRICSGGNTGREADTVPCNCSKFQREITLNVSACNKYSSPSGRYIWYSPGVYSDTVSAINGCDSIINVNLSILQPSSSSTDINSCENYVSPSGRYIWSSDGIYNDTITNYQGCDSMMVVNLTILHSSNASFEVQSCGKYSSPSGKYNWTSSGIYHDTIQNQSGCDSIITLNLAIINPNINVLESGDSLIASADSAQYQWLDCGNNHSEIDGATGSIFVPSQSGEYAVIVNQKNCKDTSECLQLILTSVLGQPKREQLSIYPNPSSGDFYIEMPSEMEKVDIELQTVLGQSVTAKTYYNTKLISVRLSEPRGIYFLLIKFDANKQEVIKLILQ